MKKKTLNTTRRHRNFAQRIREKYGFKKGRPPMPFLHFLSLAGAESHRDETPLERIVQVTINMKPLVQLIHIQSSEGKGQIDVLERVTQRINFWTKTIVNYQKASLSILKKIISQETEAGQAPQRLQIQRRREFHTSETEKTDRFLKIVPSMQTEEHLKVIEKDGDSGPGNWSHSYEEDKGVTSGPKILQINRFMYRIQNQIQYFLKRKHLWSKESSPKIHKRVTLFRTNQLKAKANLYQESTIKQIVGATQRGRPSEPFTENLPLQKKSLTFLNESKNLRYPLAIKQSLISRTKILENSLKNILSARTLNPKTIHKDEPRHDQSNVYKKSTFKKTVGATQRGRPSEPFTENRPLLKKSPTSKIEAKNISHPLTITPRLKTSPLETKIIHKGRLQHELISKIETYRAKKKVNIAYEETEKRPSKKKNIKSQYLLGKSTSPVKKREAKAKSRKMNHSPTTDLVFAQPILPSGKKLAEDFNLQNNTSPSVSLDQSKERRASQEKSPPLPTTSQIKTIADKVYRRLEKRLRIEREWMGWKD